MEKKLKFGGRGGGVMLKVLSGFVNNEYRTNENNCGGTYCTVLDTSVSFLL